MRSPIMRLVTDAMTRVGCAEMRTDGDRDIARPMTSCCWCTIEGERGKVGTGHDLIEAMIASVRRTATDDRSRGFDERCLGLWWPSMCGPQRLDEQKPVLWRSRDVTDALRRAHAWASSDVADGNASNPNRYRKP